MAIPRSILAFAVVSIAQGLASPQAPGAESMEKSAARLAGKYGIDVVFARPRFPVQTTHGRIDGRQAPRKELETYALMLAEEWNLYPVEYVKKSRLRAMVLCEQLSFAGQRRTAVPDLENDVLYFDVARGRRDDTYTRSVVHHEFFHVVDYRDDGRLYSDPVWSALNPKGFTYGRGGKSAQDDSGAGLFSDAAQGFLNRYSTLGVEEDKAEIFANLVVRRDSVDARARNDKIIDAKVRRMMDLVRAFCPQMDASFWEAARKIRRGS